MKKSDRKVILEAYVEDKIARSMDVNEEYVTRRNVGIRRN